MAEVKFRLIDFGFVSVMGQMPIVEFVPGFQSGTAAVQSGSNRLLPSKPIAATLDSSGYGTVNLVPNQGTKPDTWYTIRVTYPDSAGNFTTLDLLDTRVWVPAEGGALETLPGMPPSPDYVLVSTDPPPEGYSGWYYSGGLGDPNDPLETGTGLLYRVVA